MKNSVICRGVFSVMAMLLLVGCQKASEHQVSMKNEDIAGSYAIRSLSWYGMPVDLDGDGVMHEDLMAEYKGLHCYQYTEKQLFNTAVTAKIYPIEKVGGSSPVLIKFPMQGIVDNQYSIAAEDGTAEYRYFETISPTLTMNAAGELLFDYKEALPYLQDNAHVDEVLWVRILSLQHGVMVLQLDCRFLNQVTHHTECGTIYATYVRLSTTID